MNIMIVSDNPQRMSNELGILHDKPPTDQLYFPIVILTETESALSPLFDLDLNREPNQHTIIITDNPNKLWQGARETQLDVIIEINNVEAERWFVNLIRGSIH